MMRKFLWLWVLSLVLISGGLFASAAEAQRVYIDINQPSFEQLPIAIPDFKRHDEQMPQLSGEMARLLASALDFSGIFRILDSRGFLADPQAIGVDQAGIRFEEWRRLGADFLVRGQYRLDADNLTLEMRLFDSVAGRMVVGKQYSGRQADRQQMILRFADEILFALTGERGNFQTKIAFVQQQGKDREICVVDFDGSNLTCITAERGLYL